MLKRFMLFMGMLFLSISLLVACSSNSEDNQSINDRNEDEISKKDNDGEPGEEESNDEPDASSDAFDDQVDLKIGDTGKVATTLGEHEITIKSIKEVEDIDGESPMFDRFFIADVLLKNIGDEAIDARDSIEILEITEDLDGSGAEDTSPHFSSIDGLSGTVGPGESISGQAVFEGREADTYYIRVVSGLLAAGGVKNDLRWTFTMDEIQ